MNERVNIATKELIPVVMVGALWGKHWEGEIVNCRCDNKAVVAVLKSRTSKDSNLMHLLRCLAFLEARYTFRIVSTHLAGVGNTLADDLSRNHLSHSYRLPKWHVQSLNVQYHPVWWNCCATQRQTGHLKPEGGCSDKL